MGGDGSLRGRTFVGQYSDKYLDEEVQQSALSADNLLVIYADLCSRLSSFNALYALLYRQLSELRRRISKTTSITAGL